MITLNPVKLIANAIMLSIAKKRLKGITTLAEAVPVAFVLLPPGASVIGPKGRIKLMRNMLPLGHKLVAEMLVVDNISGQELFGYSLGQDDGLRLQGGYSSKPADWRDKW